MCKQGTASKFVAALVAATTCLAMPSPLSAQGPWQPSAPMRPVPRIGHESRSPQNHRAPQGDQSQNHRSRDPGWNLQWRRSSNASATNGQVSNSTRVHASEHSAAPHDAVAQAVGNSDHRDGRLRPVSGELQLRSPDQRAALADPIPVSSPSPHAHIAQTQNTQDFFSDPFGDDPLPSTGQGSVTPMRTRVRAPNPRAIHARAQGDEFDSLFETLPDEMPAPKALQETPTPVEPNQNALRGDKPFRDSIPSLPEELPQPDAPTETDGFELPPENAPSERNELPSPQSREPSMRDLLERERPDHERRSEEDGDDDAEASEEMDDDNLEDDDESEEDDYENPFKNREADERDRDRLNSGEDSEEEDDREPFGEDTTEDEVAGMSCDEFRDAIRNQTIDQVSLDISDPYRPDEIDLRRYKKLKQNFDEKQTTRTWRNTAGVPLATGRFRDLAYEQVVIETEYGSTERLQLDRLSEADHAYIAKEWGIPNSCLLEQVAYAPRSWIPTTVTWKASNACHNPLYFEDVNLERYGHTRGPLLEPLYQTAHFFGNIAVLPYKMGVHHPTECQYSLGYYRPGNCAPWITPPVPISLQGAYNQAAVMTGLFLLVP